MSGGFGIHIEAEGLNELIAKIESMPEAIRAAVFEKLGSLTELLEKRVLDNLSGKILHEKTGDLKSRIRSFVASEGETGIGFVGPVPDKPKDWALEFGGKGYYTIVPTKAHILAFMSKSGEMVYTHEVNHPPSREFRYLRAALEELAPEIFAGFHSALDEALR